MYHLSIIINDNYEKINEYLNYTRFNTKTAFIFACPKYIIIYDATYAIILFSVEMKNQIIHQCFILFFIP